MSKSLPEKIKIFKFNSEILCKFFNRHLLNRKKQMSVAVFQKLLMTYAAYYYKKLELI